MKNYIQDGSTLDYQNDSGQKILSGDVVIAGSLAGIANTDIEDGEEGSITVDGVFELAKHVGTAISQGDELFWNTTDKEVTKTATDKPIGTAHKSELAAATTVHVKLYGSGNGVPVAANVAAIAVADGNDLATTQALANQTKATVNAILTSLKNAGLMASS